MGNERTSRKDLIRRYRETPRPMGVYRIRNLRSGRSLLGSSPDVRARLNRHEAQLRMGLHPDRELQRDWTRLGAGAVVFEVLDTLEPPADPAGHDPAAELQALELLWGEKLGAELEGGYGRAT